MDVTGDTKVLSLLDDIWDSLQLNNVYSLEAMEAKFNCYLRSKLQSERNNMSSAKLQKVELSITNDIVITWHLA